MGTAVVLGRWTELYLVQPDGAVERFSQGPRGPDAGDALPPSLVRTLRGLGAGTTVAVDTEARRSAVERECGKTASLVELAVLRQVRDRLTEPSWEHERRAILALAAQRLGALLASPEEVLISLAREEERLERAVGREARAAESLLVPDSTPLSEYASAWTGVRQALERHLDALQRLTDAQARRVAPNLSAVVGPRVAARLIAAAGGVTPLARMRSARLQLLGSRRRPSPDRGPRYGVLYRADRMGDVPPDRRGAYARSLAALAAIAVRADAITHSDARRGLVERRDRRVEQLRRQAR